MLVTHCHRLNERIRIFFSESQYPINLIKMLCLIDNRINICKDIC